MPYQSIFTPKPSSNNATQPAGGYKSIFNPPKATPAPKVSGSTNGIPNTALQGSLGGGYGTSNITDLPREKSANSSSLGKPLLTYENTKTMSSELLSDRTAPTFDPTVPQKIDPAILQNGRMPDSIRVSLKQALGGSTWQELDHIMPLELGGSNAKGNLQLEHGADTSKPYSSSNPTKTDPIENSLADQVHSGKISLADAWKLMGQAKGVTLPEQGGAVPNQNEFPAKTPSVLDNVANFVKNVGTGDKKQVDSVFNALGGDAILHPLKTLNTIVDNAKKGADAVLQNALTATAQAWENGIEAQKGIIPFNDPKSTASILNLFTSMAGVALFSVSEPFSIATHLPVIKPVAEAVGVVFDKAGKIVSFGADKALDAAVQTGVMKQSTANILRKPIEDVASLAGQIILGGYVYGKVTGLTEAKGGVSAADGAKIAKDAQAKAEELNKAPLPKPTLTDIASKPDEAMKVPAKMADIKTGENGKTLSDMAEKVGLVPKEKAIKSGIVKPKEKTVEKGVVKPTEKPSSVPKELQPLAEEAKKYKSAEEFVKGIQEKTIDLPTDFVNQFVRSRGGRSIGENISSLEKGFDRAKPIDLVVNGDGTASLGDGNGRALAAKYLGMKDVPVRITVNNNFSIKDFPESKSFSLTDFYNKSTKEAQPKITKTKKTNSEITQPKVRYAKQLKPIEGTGKTRVRGLSEGVESKAIASTPSRLPSFAPEEAKGIERSQVASKLTDIFGELPTYKTMDVADQGAKAVDLFEKDPESAKQIAYGAKASPKGLTPEAVYVAVEQHAIENQDIQTLKELANSRLTQEATTMGQRIRMLAERNPERPTDAIRAVQEARVKAVQDKIGEPIEKATKKIVEQEAPKIKDAIEKAKSTRKISWAEFAESIKC